LVRAIVQITLKHTRQLAFVAPSGSEHAEYLRCGEKALITGFQAPVDEKPRYVESAGVTIRAELPGVSVGHRQFCVPDYRSLCGKSTHQPTHQQQFVALQKTFHDPA